MRRTAHPSGYCPNHRTQEPHVTIWFNGEALVFASARVIPSGPATYPLSRARRIAERGLDPIYGLYAGPDSYAELRDPATNEVLETVMVDPA